MIQVIHRALNILEYIASDSSREFGLSEIANMMELNPGTCANILKTLVQRNYVEQTGAKKGYKLGYMMYRICDSDSYNDELTRIAKEAMNRLGEELNEAVILSVIKNDRRLILHETFPNRELQVKTTIESSVFRATTGRMIISYYSPKELDNLIGRIGLPDEEDWPEVKTKEDLIQQLDIIRKNNFEFYCNRNHVIGLATPIFKNNKIIASLGIYLPNARYGAVEKKSFPALLRKATEVINEKINAEK
ncbi:MAG: helix-turn-helix domain-containing protein [Tannerellaceae bacterium]|jgi:DNA-binding IclR family transcriptional regulator|nr:helix-turn-helix domain-containing protein [Tannerellaceae bacterium]